MNMKRFGLSALAAFLAIGVLLIGASAALAQSDNAASSAPSNLAAEIDGDYVVLTWTPGTNPDYTDQMVREWETNNEDATWAGTYVGTDDSRYESPMANYEPGRTYSFRIARRIARESDGWKEQSGTSNTVGVSIPAEPPTKRKSPPSKKRSPTPSPPTWPQRWMTAKSR